MQADRRSANLVRTHTWTLSKSKPQAQDALSDQVYYEHLMSASQQAQCEFSANAHLEQTLLLFYKRSTPMKLLQILQKCLEDWKNISHLDFCLVNLDNTISFHKLAQLLRIF